MHKKQIKTTLLTIGIIACFTACGNANQNHIDNTESQHLQNSQMDTTSTEFMVEQFSEQPLDIQKYSIDYKLETDDQPYFLWNRVTKSELGYYYFNRSNLMFLDAQSKREVPLCNQADCSHTTSDCNSYYGAMDYDYNTSDLQYYTMQI